MKTRAGFWAGLVLMALILSGCGLFGDSDESASPEPVEVEPVAQTVRVEFEDRWFDVDPTQATTSTVEATIVNLGANDVAPTDAGVAFDGTQFALVPSIPGSEPDPDALRQQLQDVAVETTAIALPFRSIPPELTDGDAQRYASELNVRLGEGLEVSVGNTTQLLSAESIGAATTVQRIAGEWDISVDFARIDAQLRRLFPNRSEGGQASFTVLEGETDEDPPTVEVVPGAPSILCCDEASADQIANVLSTARRPINLLLATDQGEFGTEWAEGLGITERVATFSTRYTPGQTRNINIQRIAELTQGVIIEPGETFSLNEFVGRRTEENGFVPAGTIVNGHLVDSVGGGISQYATTLFNASFFAGLEFEAYQSHSIYFSRYPYGREATISWPAPSLRINNPTPYAILIWPTATDRSITVDLFSTKWVDTEQTAQWERAVGEACTRVFTERTRTFLDEDTEPLVDTVFATYRPEGIACDGTATDDPDNPTTTTSVDPNAPTTSVDPNAPTTSVDPDAPTTTSTTTSSTTTTTTAAPSSTEAPETTAASPSTSTTSTTTTSTTTTSTTTTSTTTTTEAP